MNQIKEVDAADMPSESKPVYQKVLVMAAMMSVMAGSLTGVMTYVNLGFSDGFASQWLSSFLMAAFVMAPIGMGTMTMLTKAMAALFPRVGEGTRNIAIGVLMALIMESLMAFTTTFNNVGLSDISLFFESWFNSFVVALPVGLVLMSVMSTTIKPKVEAFLKS